jgi:hypothetical protein
MTQFMICALAYVDVDRVVVANSTEDPTFKDYLDLEQCLPYPLPLTYAIDSTFYLVDSDACLIVAKHFITMSDNQTRYFKNWRVGGFESYIEYPYRQLSLMKGMGPFAVAVYGPNYIKGKLSPDESKKFAKKYIKA